MSEINDGGPAFPYVTAGYTNLGMSLRDWFAGQALAGLMVDADTRGSHVAHSQANRAEFAVWAYAMADAMLAARSAKR